MVDYSLSNYAPSPTPVVCITKPQMIRGMYARSTMLGFLSRARATRGHFSVYRLDCYYTEEGGGGLEEEGLITRCIHMPCQGSQVSICEILTAHTNILAVRLQVFRAAVGYRNDPHLGMLYIAAALPLVARTTWISIYGTWDWASYTVSGGLCRLSAVTLHDRALLLVWHSSNMTPVPLVSCTANCQIPSYLHV